MTLQFDCAYVKCVFVSRLVILNSKFVRVDVYFLHLYWCLQNLKNLKSDERLVDSWLRLFLSVDCSLDATHRSSTASQTGKEQSSTHVTLDNLVIL